MNKDTCGHEMIACERKRQQETEGWTPEHDAQHEGGELALAAVAYASPYPVQVLGPVLAHPDDVFSSLRWADPWPWGPEWDKRKKHDRIRQLAIAGALICAEIDRLKAVPEAQQ